MDKKQDWPEADSGFGAPTSALRNLSHSSPSNENLIFSQPDKEYSQLLQRMRINGPGA